MDLKFIFDNHSDLVKKRAILRECLEDVYINTNRFGEWWERSYVRDVVTFNVLQRENIRQLINTLDDQLLAFDLAFSRSPLSFKEKIIARHLLAGSTITDISFIMGCTHQNISASKKKILQKIENQLPVQFEEIRHEKRIESEAFALF